MPVAVRARCYTARQERSAAARSEGDRPGSPGNLLSVAVRARCYTGTICSSPLRGRPDRKSGESAVVAVRARCYTGTVCSSLLRGRPPGSPENLPSSRSEPAATPVPSVAARSEGDRTGSPENLPSVAVSLFELRNIGGPGSVALGAGCYQQQRPVLISCPEPRLRQRPPFAYWPPPSTPGHPGSSR